MSAESMPAAAGATPGLPGARWRARVLYGSASGLVAVAAASLWIGSHGRSETTVVVAALAVVWALTGAWLAAREQFAMSALVLAISADLAVGSLAWSIDRHGHASAVGFLADLLERLTLALGPVLAAHLLVALPDGHLVTTTARRFVGSGYAVAVLVAVGLMAVRDQVIAWPVVLLWILPLLALPIAHARYRRVGAIDRRRLQWFGWAIVVAVEIVLVAGALTVLADWPHHVAAIALAASALVPLSLVAGTIPRFIARVDRLLTHTASLTGLTALIVGVYLVALAAFGRTPNANERTLLLLSMAAAAAAALAYQPARAWLSERTNRVVYGQRVSPDEALRTWGARLTRAIPLDELLLQLAEALRKSLLLQSAQVWTGSDGRYEVAASVPHQEGTVLEVGPKELPVVARAGVRGGRWLEIWLPGLVGPIGSTVVRVAPISHAEELLGLLVCERRHDAEPFTEDDDRVLTELARQVGLALHNVQLDTALQASLDELRETNDELRASRTRIVAAGDSERRKLERNLHDGAQQHLVALAVKLRLARDAITDDPADAETMIDEIRGDVQEAIAELRSLAHGIFPPLLMSGGLPEALPAATARAGLDAHAEIEASVGRHGPEVEAAVYFCCLEALQNAAKHAGANASAVVRVWEDDTILHWEVQDDGPGFDAAGTAGAGHGFVNMRDRLGAFGGTLEIDSGAGTGTTVRGHVPLD